MRSKAEMIRNRYPVGTRICCDEMPDDPNPIYLAAPVELSLELMMQVN